MMKRCMLLGYASLSAMAFAHDKSHDAFYTAETGYVTLDASDTGNGANSSFHSANNWSDGKAPHSGTNYYVKAEKTLYLDYVHDSSEPDGFEGDSLVVAGEVRMSGAWGQVADCGPLTMLPDSSFYWVNVGHVTGGSVDVKGTGSGAGKAVRFLSGRQDDTNAYAMKALMTFSSDVDGELHWQLANGKNQGVTFTVLDDWPDFRGTFRIGSQLVFQTENGSYRTPGRLIISPNAMLTLSADAGASEIGTLTILSNGVLNLSAVNGLQTVRVARKLEVEPGAIVIPQSFDGDHVPAHEFHPVFELSAEAVGAGLPDFAAIQVAMCGREFSLSEGHSPKFTIFPKLTWVVRDAADGGKVVGFSYKETVAVKESMSYPKNGFVENGTGSLDPALYWGDGLYPQSGKEYYCRAKYNLIIAQTAKPYVFPGDSFLLDGASLGIYYDVTFPNIVLAGNGRVRLLSKDAVYHLRGTATAVRKGNEVSFRIVSGDRSTMSLDSDIAGDGVLRFCMDTEQSANSWDKTLPCGFVELTGDNSAFSGKMVVDCWQETPPKYAPYFGEAPYVAGPASNITLRVSSQKNLGGALPKVTYDALTISNECRLTVKSTADFDEPTRGWYFPQNAYLKVEQDAVATVTSPLTFGAKVVKEGRGVLMLGGTAMTAAGAVSRPKIHVAEGALGFISASSVAGLDVEFAAGAYCRIPAKPGDAEFAAKGVCLTNASLSSAGNIPVVIDMSGVDVAAKERVSVAICTVPSDQAQAYAGILSVVRPARGYSAKIVPVENGDMTTTLCALVGPNGFAVVLR